MPSILLIIGAEGYLLILFRAGWHSVVLIALRTVEVKNEYQPRTLKDNDFIGVVFY
jgi:hypothetical protein